VLRGVPPAADEPRRGPSVVEPPEGGRANRAARAAIARALGVAPSAVTVVQGAEARDKALRVAGDPQVLAARLRGAVEA
jgi:uncharacterized protein YggU (UPF0235/DUF167 family)